ncbi:hypothetical protein E4O05_09520 [Treponema sp. OMZ 787]|uniref:toxin TcdB middle/N-terminal domain-containing protein n=1 Tax=Treponema sp. OMZ 787 TaxID=2563669 RepID=UPI0020A412EF|nr:toxin TcdB middle/N-terminal domain-containing protein [Treponema sp. OMZ 787]UTC61768.1 hypothetical protein E4O05_09520 [Treponema sp. OMZ 787]
MKKVLKVIKEKGISIILFIVYMTVGVLPVNLYAAGAGEGQIKIKNSILLVSKVIGKEGGVIEAGGVIFEVPKGALEKEVEIKISRLIRVEEGEVKNVTAGLGGYRFEPAGIKFKKECLVKMAYDDRIEEEYAQEVYTYYYDKKKKSWEALKRKGVDTEKKVIESYTDHFTDMINGTLSLPESPSPVSINLNSIKELKAADAVGGIESIEGLKGGSEGSASFNMRLQVPGGVRGFTPELAVSYSSGSGYGLLGKGFSLSGIESISIDTRLGLPLYNGKDTYLINGIKVRHEGGKWKEERKQSYSAIRNDWAEGRGSGNYFEIKEKDGSVKIYGAKNWSGESEGRKYIYYLDEKKDSFGNIIEYRYEKQKDEEGEEVLLKEIVYGKERERRIKIEYEGREDERVDGRGRYLKKESKRIREIKSEVRGEEVKRYEFKYKANTFLESILESIEVRGQGKEEGRYAYNFEYEQAEKERDGSIRAFGESERWYKETNIFEQSKGAISVSEGHNSGSNFSWSTGLGVGPAGGGYDIRGTYGQGSSDSEGVRSAQQCMVDINGDGKVDAVRMVKNGISVMLNNGQGFDAAKIWKIDIDGIEKENTWNMSLSHNAYIGAGSPKGGAAGVTYSNTEQMNGVNLETSFIDIDGDRFLDIALIGKKYYLKNTGSGFEVKPFANIKNLRTSSLSYNDEDVKKYNAIYHQQNPFRQWRSKYGGEVRIDGLAVLEESNKNKNGVELKIYSGNTLLIEDRIYDEKRNGKQNTKVRINDGDSLFFVPYGNCNMGGQLINWNIKLKYEKIKPFNDMNKKISWRIENGEVFFANELKIIRTKDGSNIKKDYENILNEGVNGTTDDVRKKTAAEYMIAKRNFLPIIIDKEKIKILLEADGYESEENQNEIKKTIGQMYKYDISKEQYILLDEDLRKSKVVVSTNEFDENEKKLKNILKSIDINKIKKLLVYENKYIIKEAKKRIFMNDGFFTGEEWIGSRDNKNREIGIERIGYIGCENNIYLDKLNNKNLILKGNDVYLGKEKIGQAEIKKGYRSITVLFKIKDSGSYAEYECCNYQPKGFKLGKNEIEKIFEYKQKEKEYNTNNSRWHSINEKLYSRLVNTAVREIGEDGQNFLSSIYIVGFNSYNLKSQLDDEEIAKLNRILKLFGEVEYAESLGYEYDEINKTYNLKDSEYLNLVEAVLLEQLNEAQRRDEILKYENLEKKVENEMLGRYEKIKRKIRYNHNDEYMVMNDGINDYIKIPIFEKNKFEYIKIDIENWDSGRDYVGKDVRDDIISYTTESEVELAVTVEEDGLLKEKKQKEIVKSINKVYTEEILAGGYNQWFYGVWMYNQTEPKYEFAEKKLKPDFNKTDIDEFKKDIQRKNSNKEEAMKNVDDKYTLFYYPLMLNQQILNSEGEYENITRENEIDVQIDDSCYVGRITEDILVGKNEVKTYAPFINKDMIFINRAGGVHYYKIIDKLKQVSNECILIKSSGSINKEHSFANSFNFEKIEDKLGVNIVEKFKKDLFSLAKKMFEKILRKLLSNFSFSFSNGKTSTGILLTDFDGNGTADFIKSSHDGQRGVFVNLNFAENFSEAYKVENLNAITESEDESKTYGSGISRSGSVKKIYDSNGKVLTSIPLSGSVGGGFSFSHGGSCDKLSFIDINGDGLPDSIGENNTYLNVGDRVIEYNGLNTNLEKRDSYTLSGSFNIGAGSELSGEGKTAIASLNASASISYSGSYNLVTQRLVNLRSGYVDAISAGKDEAYLHLNTGGKFVDKRIKIKLPKWNYTTQEGANIFYLIDGNVFISFLNNFKFLRKINLQHVESAFTSSGLSLNPLSFKLLQNINSIGLSSSVTLSGSIGGGATTNIPIPIFKVQFNIPAVLGKGFMASGLISGVNVSMLDMDGDGLADRVLRIPGSNGAVYVQRNLLGKVGLLKKIKLPQGGSYELKYERVGNTVELPQSKYVLSEVTAKSGLKSKTGNSQEYRTYYTYEDGYYNRAEKEFYGFKTVKSKNTIGTVTETEYYIDFYYRKGMVKRETVKNGSRVYSIKEYETDAAPHARIKKEVNTIRENYNEIKTESEYEYDKYGNVTKLYDKGEVTNTNDDIIAEITYWKGGREDKYFKAHPEKIQVLHGKTGTLLRKREGAYDSRTGALTELKQYTSHGAYLVNRIEWTEDGNIKTVTSPTGKRAEYKYLDGIYPIEIKEISSKGDKSYTSKIEWDRILGVKLKETDAANNTMSYSYDNFGRVTEVRSPYDTSETPYAKYTYITPKDSFWYTVTENKISTEAEDSNVMKTIVLHDGLGRISYTAKEGEVYIDGTADSTQTGWNISSAINYDNVGRKIEEGMPFFYGGNLESDLKTISSYEAIEQFYELNNFTSIRNGTKYEYDDIDRPVVTTLPDGYKQKTEYSIENSLQITKTTDPLENISISKKDARGNIREVERLDQTNTLLTKARYEYSVLGEMLRAYDANENLLSVSYDLLGRRTALESKDTGKKEWIYDDKGRLQAETDSVLKNKAAEIRYEYDGFDRIVKTDYPFSPDIEYEYGEPEQNGAGQIVYKKDETGETRYKYGYLNEVTKETRTINRYGAGSNPETASFEYRSDYLGRMQSMKYPDGETITYSYDKGGQLSGVSGVKTSSKGTAEYSYVDKILYDEHAQRVYIKYGNGVETRYQYDEKRRWLDSIETKNVQTQDVFQKIKYNFDAVGNVLGYNNDASTYETKQEYKYDNLYQLINVEGTSKQYKTKKSFGATPVSIAKYKQTFAFDGIGNMKEKLSTTNIPGAQGNSYPKAELDYSLNYEYDSAYAHRLIRAGNRYYRYDANGNITAEKDGPFTDEEEFVFTYSYFEEQDVYGADYGFGLDAPKETEQSNPQDLFAYRRNYTWNERNLLTKSSDRNYTVHYRYGEDGQRALKYTDEGRSETLYFNNFFTIHIPTQDQNNPQGLRVHKHIFVGNSRLVTAMTHTENQGDNDEQKAKRYYYHSDHLGSAQFVTDWKGRQYEHIEYTPYGELWVEEVAAGLDKLPFRFTGKELDEETGLYYYGARYLDPKYSRWLSGDPALGEYIPKAPIDDEAKKHNENLPGMGGVFNTVNLHVYHYAGNNPVKYTDPTGKFFIIDDLIGAVIQSIRDNNWSNFGEKFKSNFINTWKLIGHSIAMLPQTLWFAPQEILGLLLGYGFILGSGGTVDWDGGFKYVNLPNRKDGITLGSIGMGHPSFKSHEKGHYYQSWILGPLYLFVIGIPSIIHAAMHNTNKCNRCNELRENGDDDPYKHFWTEQWAEKYNKEKNKEEKK